MTIVAVKKLYKFGTKNQGPNLSKLKVKLKANKEKQGKSNPPNKKQGETARLSYVHLEQVEPRDFFAQVLAASQRKQPLQFQGPDLPVHRV